MVRVFISVIEAWYISVHFQGFCSLFNPPRVLFLRSIARFALSNLSVFSLPLFLMILLIALCLILSFWGEMFMYLSAAILSP